MIGSWSSQRTNAVSAGAIRTLSLAGIQGGRQMHAKSAILSALKEHTAVESVAGTMLWLVSDLGRSATGEVVHVDAGFHSTACPVVLVAGLRDGRDCPGVVLVGARWLLGRSGGSDARTASTGPFVTRPVFLQTRLLQQYRPDADEPGGGRGRRFRSN